MDSLNTDPILSEPVLVHGIVDRVTTPHEEEGEGAIIFTTPEHGEVKLSFDPFDGEDWDLLTQWLGVEALTTKACKGLRRKIKVVKALFPGPHPWVEWYVKAPFARVVRWDEDLI